MRFGKVMPVLVLVTVLVGIVGSYVAAAEIPYRTGAILVSPEEYSKLTSFKFVPVTGDVYKHLIEIAPGYPRTPPISKDALMGIAAPGPVPPDSLPTSVNNSLYLPPIGNQGIVGSCNAWASTYYVWTYMINWFQNNPHPHTIWDIMNPTFTYNLINDGQVSDSNGDGIVEDHGSLLEDAMNLISTVGAVPYGAFQVYNGLNYGLWDEDWNQTIINWYSNDPASFNNWLSHVISVWPEEAQWKQAPYNRGVSDMYSSVWGGPLVTGIIYVIDLTNSTQFQYLKGLLAAGYVAETAIYVYDEFMNFDPNNNVYALNQAHSGNPGGHAVTIVGYNDNKVTPDGDGALLMVNSWGVGWGDHGYWWLTYQAAQDPNHKLSYGKAYIFVPKESQPYKPKITARFKITHSKRGEIIGGLYDPDTYVITAMGGIELGVGGTSSPIWNQRFFNFYIGYVSSPSSLSDYQAHPFPDSPIVLDLTDSLEALSHSDAVNSQYIPFYIRIADKYGDGVTGTLDSFEIIVNSTYLHRVIEASTSFPVSIPEDGSWLTISVDVPIVDYIGITPLDKQELNTNWAYIEVGSIVNMSGAVLHFNGQDYTMDMDNSYHAYYNISGLNDGSYTYRVIVTLQNGDIITLPQRTITVSSSEEVMYITSLPYIIAEPGYYVLNISTSVNGTAITINSDEVILDGNGHTITGNDTGYGVHVNTKNDVTIKNLKIKNFLVGVKLLSSSNVTIVNNNIANSTYGVLPAFSSNVKITNNTIMGNDYGVHLEYSLSNVILVSNNITNNTYGVHISSSGDVTIINNDILGNGLYGVHLYSSSNVAITNNIIANNSYGVALASSSNVMIVTNIITNSTYGIHISSSDNVTLINNSITGDLKGVYLEYSSSNVKTTNNTIMDTINGITISSSGNVTIANNTITNNSEGVHLYSSSNVTMTNNIIAHSGYGIGLCSSSNVILVSNNITNNTYGVHISSSGDVTIINNDILGNGLYGVHLYSSSNVTVVDNEFWGVGLVVWESFRNTVVNNTVNGRPLIYVESADGYSLTKSNYAGQVIIVNSSNVLIANQNITNTSFGIQLLNVTNATIINNIITNSREGVNLYRSSDITITSNAITNNLEGVYFEYSGSNVTITNVMIINNIITNNNVGIFPASSSDVTITNNIIANSSYGIALVSSSNVGVFLNYFADNWKHINVLDSENVFFTSSKPITYAYNGEKFTNYLGNYWDNYTGTDSNGDGIGDTPYIVFTDSSANMTYTDDHPLIVLPWEYVLNPSGANISVVNLTVEPIEGVVPFNATINVTLENTGDVAGDYTLFVDVWHGGLQTATIETTVEVRPKSTLVVTFPYGITEAGEYVVKAGNFTETIRALAPADFVLSNLTVEPTEGIAPLNITVSAVVGNTGDVIGNYTAVLYVDGKSVANKTVEVPARGTVKVEFSHTLEEPGVHNVTMGDLEPIQVNVLKSANIKLVGLYVEPIEALVPFNTTIKVLLTNTGDIDTENYTVTIYINDEKLTKNVTVKPGVTMVVTFIYEVIQPGTYVVKAGDFEETVTALAPAEFVISNLTVRPLNGTAPFNVTVSAVVTNVGDVAGNYTAVLYIDGKSVANKTVEVPARKHVSIEFTYEFTDDMTGVHNITINNLEPIQIKVYEKYYATIGEYPDRVKDADTVYFVFNNLGTVDAFSASQYISRTIPIGVRTKSDLAVNFNLSVLKPNDVLISVGGPLVNSITAHYEPMAPVHMVIERGTITIVTPQRDFTWTVPTIWWNVSEGYFIIQMFHDNSGALVVTIYGTDADSTAAGAYYFMNVVYPNIEEYNGVRYLVGLWNDTEQGADVPLPGTTQGDTSGFSAGDSITIVAEG